MPKLSHILAKEAQMPQSAFTCLKLTKETIEQSVKYIRDTIFVQHKLHYESGVSLVKKPMNTPPGSENPNLATYPEASCDSPGIVTNIAEISETAQS